MMGWKTKKMSVNVILNDIPVEYRGDARELIVSKSTGRFKSDYVAKACIYILGGSEAFTKHVVDSCSIGNFAFNNSPRSTESTLLSPDLVLYDISEDAQEFNNQVELQIQMYEYISIARNVHRIAGELKAKSFVDDFIKMSVCNKPIPFEPRWETIDYTYKVKFEPTETAIFVNEIKMSQEIDFILIKDGKRTIEKSYDDAFWKPVLGTDLATELGGDVIRNKSVLIRVKNIPVYVFPEEGFLGYVSSAEVHSRITMLPESVEKLSKNVVYHTPFEYIIMIDILMRSDDYIIEESDQDWCYVHIVDTGRKILVCDDGIIFYDHNKDIDEKEAKRIMEIYEDESDWVSEIYGYRNKNIPSYMRDAFRVWYDSQIPIKNRPFIGWQNDGGIGLVYPRDDKKVYYCNPVKLKFRRRPSILSEIPTSGNKGYNESTIVSRSITNLFGRVKNVNSKGDINAVVNSNGEVMSVTFGAKNAGPRNTYTVSYLGRYYDVSNRANILKKYEPLVDDIVSQIVEKGKRVALKRKDGIVRASIGPILEGIPVEDYLRDYYIYHDYSIANRVVVCEDHHKNSLICIEHPQPPSIINPKGEELLYITRLEEIYKVDYWLTHEHYTFDLQDHVTTKGDL
jgi:hypothetical protein